MSRRKGSKKKRIDIMKEIVNFGLGKTDVALSTFQKEIGVNTYSVREYLEIAKWILENPVEIEIKNVRHFTFVTIRKKDETKKEED
ncbi:MAG: hypothetical protein ACFFDI_25660 [Promethearchaeota archaeon]